MEESICKRCGEILEKHTIKECELNLLKQIADVSAMIREFLENRNSA